VLINITRETIKVPVGVYIELNQPIWSEYMKTTKLKAFKIIASALILVLLSNGAISHFSKAPKQYEGNVELIIVTKIEGGKAPYVQWYYSIPEMTLNNCMLAAEDFDKDKEAINKYPNQTFVSASCGPVK
jgi:hypothetical protein